MQEKANIYFDSSQHNHLTRVNENNYCHKFNPKGMYLLVTFLERIFLYNLKNLDFEEMQNVIGPNRKGI